MTDDKYDSIDIEIHQIDVGNAVGVPESNDDCTMIQATKIDEDED